MNVSVANSSTDGNGTLYGWTSSPSGRGTGDILISCFTTICLCCWTSVFPNVPASSDSKWARIHDKLTLACIALLGPEFLLYLAAGQRTSAEESVKKFRQRGKTSWTLTHAFYANMGGFLLEAKQGDTAMTFPIDAEQLYYLVDKGHLDYPTVKKEEINDKNKADGLARSITIVQVVWFTANTIGRAAQGLAISALEMSTLSFIAIMFATSYFWMQKPLDVAMPTALLCNATIEQIHSEAGLAAYEWIQTPLDFINRREWSISLIWAYYTQILRKLHLPLYSRPINVKPYNRIPSDKWLKPDLFREFFSAIFIFAFAIILIAAWNFHFPTPVERTLWRIATTFNLVFTCVGGLYVWFWENFIFPARKKVKTLSTMEMATQSHNRSMSKRIAAKLRNVSNPLDPQLDVPLSFLFPITTLCAIYCIFRAYIFLEDLIGLRSLPPSAFETVNWANYVPHI